MANVASLPDDARRRAVEGMRRFLDLAGGTEVGSGPGGRSWSREDLYADRTLTGPRARRRDSAD